jgi:trehalose/maltose transport system substrate-binding protein
MPAGYFLKAALAGALALAAAAPAAAVTLTISCGSSGAELEQCVKHANDWARRTGNTVKTFSPPNNATEALSLYRQLFAAKASDVDILMIDTVWPGIIKDHLIDLSPYTKGAEANHFPAVLANFRVGGKLVGLPFYVDAGLLYYRADLLKKYKRPVPDTWEELAETAKLVQTGERAAGDTDFNGYVFQAKAFEGLTCNAAEWVASYGGSIIDADGTISVNNPRTAKALNVAATWVGTISPVGVLNYAEEDSRGVFQNGKALFMRNWPYAYALAEKPDSPIRGKIGVAVLPKGGADGRHAAALGGWALGVTRYSAHPAEAADLVLYMTSAVVQKSRAIEGAFNPTLPGLYDDADINKANPFMAGLKDVFVSAVARPSTVSGLKYPAVSQAFQNAAHAVLSKEQTGEEAARRLEAKLTLVRRFKW